MEEKETQAEKTDRGPLPEIHIKWCNLVKNTKGPYKAKLNIEFGHMAINDVWIKEGKDERLKLQYPERASGNVSDGNRPAGIVYPLTVQAREAILAKATERYEQELKKANAHEEKIPA